MKVSEKLKTIEALPGALIAFDGCHKIYVCTDVAGAVEAGSYGYDGGDFYPAADVRELWEKSCSLRFVSSIELIDTPWTIRQFEDADEAEDAS